uniref:Uncharacterized protein n=1 Tax=Rhizophora mucronata TaxID=61149 RepID=A0A2P2QK47_RHIMU
MLLLRPPWLKFLLLPQQQQHHQQRPQ